MIDILLYKFISINTVIFIVTKIATKVYIIDYYSKCIHCFNK